MLAKGRMAKDVIYDTIFGIKGSDELLINELVNDKPKPTIYCGIEVSEDMKEFLRLPSRFKLYSNVSLVNEEISSEEAADKMRWTMEEVSKEGVVLTAQQKRDKKDKDNQERAISNTKVINFSNVRASELSHNKVITMQEPAELRSGIKIQEHKLYIIETVKKFMSKNCDSKVAIKDSCNLSESEIRGKKVISKGVKEKG